MKRLPVGSVVAGPSGRIGILTAHVASHDVLVDYGGGYTALHCQKEGCDYYDKVALVSISKMVESANKSPNTQSTKRKKLSKVK